MKCRAVRIDLEELAQLRRPAILHWELDHFVVLRSVGRRRVRIVDPAVGERSLRWSELSKSFTGVALELAPTITQTSAKPPVEQEGRLSDAVEWRTLLPAFRGLGRSLTAVFLMTGAFTIVIDAAMAVGTLAILLVYEWSLTLVLIAFVTLFAVLRFGTFARMRNLTHEAIAAKAHEESSFIENVERHRAIKLLGAETLREDAWGERYVESINTDLRLARFRAHVSYVGGATAAVQAVTMLMLGAGRVLDGAFSLGMLLAFSTYSAQFSARAFALIESLVELRMLRLHRERIADIALEDRETPRERVGVQRRLRGGIEVNAVRFAYGAGPPVLNGLEFSVSPGEFVANRGGDT